MEPLAKVRSLKDNFAEGGKIEGIENFEAGRKLPCDKEGNNADDTEPVGNQFARSLPQPVRRQRIRLVDRNEIDSILFLLRRSVASGLNCEELYSRPGATVKQRDAYVAHSRSQISNSKWRVKTRI